jgi:hypothetical protein
MSAASNTPGKSWPQSVHFPELDFLILNPDIDKPTIFDELDLLIEEAEQIATERESIFSK